MIRLQGQVGIRAVLLVSMAIWGLNVTIVKQLTTGLDATTIAMLRMLVASTTLATIWVIRRPALGRLDRRQWLALAACAFLMVYMNQLLFTEGMMRTTATNGSLIMALSPLASGIIAAIAFRERLGLTRLLGVLLGLAGVAVIILGHAGAKLSVMGLGDLLVVAGILTFSFGGALIQGIARRLDALTISSIIYAMGAVMLVIHNGLWGPGYGAALPDSAWIWFLIVFSGSVSTAIANLIWNQSIARIGVARAAVFLYWVPVFGAAFAALLLGEQLGRHHLIGLVAVMVGTYLGTRAPNPV